MTLRRLAVVGVGIAGIVHALALQAGAGGNQPGTLVNCQTAHPSGAPVSLILTVTNLQVAGQTVSVEKISVLAEFGGQMYGTFTREGVVVTNVLNTMDAGCKIFNDSTLSAEILSAIGLHGTTFGFTICSLLGASHPDCGMRAGTIHTPPGWPSNQITGYAQ